MDSAPPQSLPVPADGDVNKGALINAFVWWTTVVTTALVGLRIYTHSSIIKARFSWDDWHLLLSQIGIIAIAALTSIEVSQGFGRHEHYLSDLEVVNFLTLNFTTWILTFLVLGYTKLTLFLFCIKLRPSVRIRQVLFFGVFAIVISSLIFIMVFVFQCLPVNGAWRSTVHATCMSRTKILNNILAQAITSAIFDFGLAAFPLLLIKNVPMSRLKQFGLCLITGLGILTGVCAVVRACINGQAIAADATFTTIANWFWRLFEMQLSIVCACIPSLIPLYQHVAGSLGGPKRASLTSLMNAFPSNNTSSSQVHRSSKTQSTSAASDLTTSDRYVPNSKNASEAGERRRREQQNLAQSDTEPPRKRTSLQQLVKQKAALPGSNATQPKSGLRPDHPMTFLADDSTEDLSQAASRRPTRPNTLAKTGKTVSFSTGDEPSQAPKIPAQSRVAPMSPSPPPPLPNSPFSPQQRPQLPEASRGPVVRTPPLAEGSRSVPLRPLNSVGGDDEGLALDLSPNFQRNRTTFGRILGLRRTSWTSSIWSGRSGRSDGRRPGDTHV